MCVYTNMYENGNFLDMNAAASAPIKVAPDVGWGKLPHFPGTPHLVSQLLGPLGDLRELEALQKAGTYVERAQRQPMLNRL